MGISLGENKGCRNNEVTLRHVSTVIKKGNEHDDVLTCEDRNDNNEPKTRKISAGNPVIATGDYWDVYSSRLSFITLSSAG